MLPLLCAAVGVVAIHAVFDDPSAGLPHGAGEATYSVYQPRGAGTALPQRVTTTGATPAPTRDDGQRGFRPREQHDDTSRPERAEGTHAALHNLTPQHVSESATPHVGLAWQQPGPGYDTGILHASPAPRSFGGGGKGGRR